MIIKAIKLTNFRCHSTFEYEFKKKTSVIVGENGSGKTSVLEAIYIALQGRSFRAVDAEIIKRDTDFYRIEVDFYDGEKTIVTYDGTHKQFLVGDKKSFRLSKKNKYPVVLFLPEDLHLVETSPTKKRAFFDRIISGLIIDHSSLLNRYEKALKQRNEMLKEALDSGRDVSAEIFSWNVMLAKYGTEIRKNRVAIISEINERLTEVYRSIAENEDVISIKYVMFGGEISESEYLSRLEAEFNRDLILGHTGFGIQRDNFEFVFNDSDAEGSASRGEVRSIILALKFIEAELIYNKLQKRPVVLLDDVFSELDEKRQKSITRNFKDNQVLITSVEVKE